MDQRTLEPPVKGTHIVAMSDEGWSDDALREAWLKYVTDPTPANEAAWRAAEKRHADSH